MRGKHADFAGVLAASGGAIDTEEWPEEYGLRSFISMSAGEIEEAPTHRCLFERILMLRNLAPLSKHDEQFLLHKRSPVCKQKR